MYTAFSFNDPRTTEIYTLSLHDALPISSGQRRSGRRHRLSTGKEPKRGRGSREMTKGVHGQRRGRLKNGDRKSTRLNSSHSQISYAVFCLKKKTATPAGRRPGGSPPSGT